MPQLQPGTFGKKKEKVKKRTIMNKFVTIPVLKASNAQRKTLYHGPYKPAFIFFQTREGAKANTKQLEGCVVSRFVGFCFSPNLWFTLTLLQPSDGLVRSEEFIRRTISTSEPNNQAINFRTIDFHGVTKTSKQFAQLAMALCHTSRIPSEAGHSSLSF